MAKQTKKSGTVQPVRKPKARRSAHRPLLIERHPGRYGALGYRSARVASGSGRSYTSLPGYSHDELDRRKLIAQSRDFMRNNAIYQGMIDRAVSYIVGSGFELQVNSGSKGVNKKIEGLWNDFNKRPEIRGVLSGGETAQMLIREVIVAGDTAALKTDKGLIQLFEAEQIEGKTPKNSGIEKDRYGRPVKFNLSPWKSHRVDNRNPNKVSAEHVLYIARPSRPSQIRGVPACQAAFPMLHRINDVCDSEAIAWQLIARLAVSITRTDGPEQGNIESREDPNKSASETDGDLATRLTELDYAIMFHGNPGEEVKGIERNIPGKTFSDSLRMFLRLLGLPLGMPLECILLDWTKSNYSQSRAVLQQAYQMFIFWQKKLEDFSYSPMFEWKLSHWQDQGLIGKRKVKYDWIKQTFPWIDQYKEAQAYGMQVDRGFITHGQVCKSRNLDRTEVIEQRQVEVEEAIAIAQAIELKTGEKVPWQIFCGLEPPKAAAAVPDADDENNSPNDSNDSKESEDE